MKERTVLLHSVSIVLAIVFIIMSSCRTLYYNIPELSDYDIFPYRVINPSSDSVFYFHRTEDTDYLGRVLMTNNKELLPDAVSLNDYIKGSKTVAFLIIRNDTILYEKYKSPYTESSIYNTFSVTKIFITSLIGVAINEGLIENVNQPVTDYIPELKDNNGFNDITIRHLLLHTSGIKFSDTKFSPLSDNARYYYGRNLRKLVLKAELYIEPGKEIHYSSVNVQLLGLILERATGTTLSAYMEEKIWKEIGMQYPAKWSLDNNSEEAFEKCFSCLNCTATDLARLGMLYLNKGKYRNKQVIPESFVYESTRRDTIAGSSGIFQYNIKLGPKKYESYFSGGLFGQILYIYPEKELIIIRLGEKDLSYNPQFIQHNIMQIIDQL